MRNVLRRPRTRGIVVATALAGALVLGMAPVADADFNSPRQATVPPIAASPASAEAATAASCFSTYLSYGSRGTCVKLLQKNGWAQRGRRVWRGVAEPRPVVPG